MNAPFRSILVCTDFSELGDAAVPVAVRLAADQGASLVLAHVLEEVPLPNPLYAHYARVPTPEQRAEAERHARAALEALVPSDGSAVPREVHVLHGSPVAELTRLAEERDVSLVVISSHGRGGFRRFLLGSVADAVLRRVRCSVLVLRPADEA